ncbi:CHAT domain-containing protein [Undibacterium sp. TJN19]|uniref:CHAT domain-containing protein n=1 Tax=Undibacterium sp. TJN19 TaxID=3413055 RepID=UPI003BF21858
MDNFNKSLSNAYICDPIFRIVYFIPHPDQNLSNASFFSGVTDGLAHTSRLLEKATEFPADIREVCSDWRHIALFRCYGLISHRILPIEFSAFSELMSHKLSFVFHCVLSDHHTVDFVKHELTKAKNIWLHLSTVVGDGQININSVTQKDFISLIKNRLTQLVEPNEKKFVEICLSLLNQHTSQKKKINLTATGHNLTRSNERALLAFGGLLTRGSGSPGTEKNALNWIGRSFDIVNRRRSELLNSLEKKQIPLNSMILTLPSALRGAKNSKFIGRLARSGASIKTTRYVLKFLLKPKTFLWYEDIRTFQKVTESPHLMALIQLRQKELLMYTTLLVRLAAEALVPVLRLNPSIASVHGLLIHLGECSRRPGPRKREKRYSIFKKIQALFKNEIESTFQQKINALGDFSVGIKLVSDLPLEWLPVRGLPIMLRYECSRIPIVPTSLAYAVATNLDPVLITPSQLKKILVIRSFDAHDKISKFLETGIDIANQSSEKSKNQIIFKDVSCEQEFVDALNNYEGEIVIFDCHGHFESENYIASLIIGDSPIKLWELRKKINRMPPIVLLSACDTEPIDSAHTSVGGSMLLLGAKTVLGTFLPIDAMRAAMFIGRLVYRLDAFVHSALIYRDRLTWREIVAGLIKMSHITEILISLISNGYIEGMQSEAFRTIHFNANVDINSNRADWFERFLNSLSTQLKCTTAEAQQITEKYSYLTDALLYTQLGNPELIFITSDIRAQSN